MTPLQKQTRFRQELAKNDIKQLILWFIGVNKHIEGPKGPIRVKQTDLVASHEEIEEFFLLPIKRRGKRKQRKQRKQSYIKYRDGRELSIGWRTLYRYIEEQVDDGFIEIFNINPTTYRLTENGKKRWSLVNALSLISEHILPKRPICTSFRFGLKPDDQTEFIDVLIRVRDSDVIKTIEKAIYENKTLRNHNKLGRMLLMVIMMYFKGDFSRILESIKGKEARVLSKLVENLPIHKKHLEPE